MDKTDSNVSSSSTKSKILLDEFDILEYVKQNMDEIEEPEPIHHDINLDEVSIGDIYIFPSNKGNFRAALLAGYDSMVKSIDWEYPKNFFEELPRFKWLEKGMPWSYYDYTMKGIAFVQQNSQEIKDAIERINTTITNASCGENIDWKKDEFAEKITIEMSKKLISDYHKDKMEASEINSCQKCLNRARVVKEMSENKVHESENFNDILELFQQFITQNSENFDPTVDGALRMFGKLQTIKSKIPPEFVENICVHVYQNTLNILTGKQSMPLPELASIDSEQIEKLGQTIHEKYSKLKDLFGHFYSNILNISEMKLESFGAQHLDNAEVRATELVNCPPSLDTAVDSITAQLIRKNLVLLNDRDKEEGIDFYKKYIIALKENHKLATLHVAEIFKIEEALKNCSDSHIRNLNVLLNIIKNFIKYPNLFDSDGQVQEHPDKIPKLQEAIEPMSNFLEDAYKFRLHIDALKSELLAVTTKGSQLESYLECYYANLETIAELPNGRVLKGTQLLSGGNFAIKTLRISSEDKNNLFIRKYYERHILKEIKHPHILQVIFSWIQYDYSSSAWDRDFEFCIEMELCAGSLYDYLNNRGKIEERENLRILTQILQALAYLHERHYIHRDIKPKNILYHETNGCRVYLLADFGIARRLALARSMNNKDDGTDDEMEENETNTSTYESEMTSETTCASTLRTPNEFSHQMSKEVGTPLYIAPEVLNCKNGYNEKADIYSLGKVALDLYKHKETTIEKFEIENELIQCMINKNPSYRPSASECLELFNELIPPIKEIMIDEEVDSANSNPRTQLLIDEKLLELD